ncbi:uncharacterized protein LOC129088116 [Pteronotus mesoamericanus]|uniref:uncharacterized protein LOC129088116 n=1 Tax=Pteronotus mesoamericanus TaxID=1884717 RepID=UPI0023EC9CFA|nr:uncharacterized protein LOC129088116 [Pteronotus parnellii mesoamericanus]
MSGIASGARPTAPAARVAQPRLCRGRPGSAAHLGGTRRAAVERGAPAGRRPGVRRAGRKCGAGNEVARCGQQELAADPLGGTSAGLPRPRRPSASPHIRVPLRHTHLPGAPLPPPPTPAPSSGCAVSSPDHRDCPAAGPPSRLSQLPHACPARRYTMPPPPPPPPPHRPTEYARVASMVARARARVRDNRAGLPAAVIPPRARVRPIPDPAAPAADLRDGPGGAGREATLPASPL